MFLFTFNIDAVLVARQTRARVEREQHEEVHRGAQATRHAAVATDGEPEETARRTAESAAEGRRAGMMVVIRVCVVMWCRICGYPAKVENFNT